MTLASSSRMRVAIIEETTLGTVPVSGTPDPLRITGESLQYSIQSESSKEINASRQVRDRVHAGASVSGGVNFELTYRTFDSLLEALLGSTFSSSVGYDGSAVVDADFNTSENSITITNGVDVSSVVADSWICIKDSAHNDGVYCVTTGGTASKLYLNVATPLVQTESDTGFRVSASRLSCGTDALRSFSIEKQFTDVTQYFLFTGMAPSKLSLAFSSGAVAGGSFDFMGISSSRSNTTQLPAAPGSPLTFSMINCVSGFGTFLINGFPLANTYLKSLNVSIDGKLRAQRALGHLGNVGIGQGTFEITGTMELYLADGTLYDEAIAGSKLSVQWPIKDRDGNGYAFVFDNVKLDVPTVTAGAMDSDVMLSISFTAVAPDTSTDKMIHVDRFGDALVEFAWLLTGNSEVTIGVGPVSFSRASEALYLDATASYQIAAANEPRISHWVSPTSAVAIGDSFTYVNNYQQQVHLIHPSYTLANAGVNGNTLIQMLARLQTDVIDLAPDEVLVAGGVNDVNGSASAASIEASYTSIVAALHSAGITNILINNIPPFGNLSGWTETKQGVLEEVNAWLPSFCSANGCRLVDIHTALADPGNTDNLLAVYDSGDGLHPSDQGHAAIAEAISRLVTLGGIESGYLSSPAVPNISTGYSLPSQALGTSCYYSGSAFVNDITNFIMQGDHLATCTIVAEDDQDFIDKFGDIHPSLAVYELVNPAGAVGIAYVGANGKTTSEAPAIISYYIKTFPGGHYKLQDNNGGGFTDQYNTRYAEVRTAYTPVTNSRGVVVADPGETIRFVAYSLTPGSSELANLPPVLTYGSAYTKEADVLSCPVENIDPTEGVLYFEWTPMVDAADVISLTIFDGILTYDGINLEFTDGTNTAQYALATVAGTTYKVCIRWGAGLQIIVDGSAGTEESFDGSLTLGIDLTLGNEYGQYIRNIVRHPATLTEAGCIALTA